MVTKLVIWMVLVEFCDCDGIPEDADDTSAAEKHKKTRYPVAMSATLRQNDRQLRFME